MNNSKADFTTTATATRNNFAADLCTEIFGDDFKTADDIREMTEDVLTNKADEFGVADCLPRTCEQAIALAALPYLKLENLIGKASYFRKSDMEKAFRAIGRALYKNGNTLSDWIQWSKTQPSEVVGNAHETCAEHWEEFKEIGKKYIRDELFSTIIEPAKKAGFSISQFSRERKLANGQSDDAAQTPPPKATETSQFISAQDVYEEDDADAQDDKAEPPAQKKPIPELQPPYSEQTEPARDTAEISADRDDTIAAIRDACKWNLDKYGKRTSIKPTSANMNLIFTNDPNLRGLFGVDEFQQATVFLRQPPWRKDDAVRKHFEDSDDAQLSFYLRENYAEFHSKQLVYEATVVYAKKNAFHDVKDYFYNLPRWDGKPRAESIFIDFLRADDTSYTREVTHKWLLGAVARIFRPGCRFQLAIVLQGEQGIGKSYTLERLGGKWHGVLSDSVDDPHAIDAIQIMWICEMKEFKAARDANINSLKAFIDTSADTRRAAFERRPKVIARHCVFAATVNDKQILADKTGNRRFAPVECHNDAGEYVEGLTDEYVAQVWAEVFSWYNKLTANDTDRDEKKLEKALELSKDTKRQVEAVAKKFMRDDGLDSEIQGYLDTPIPAQVIWLTFTKEERRKFMADAHLYIGGGKAELETRIRNRKWNKRGIESDIDALYQLLASANEGTVYRSCGDGNAIVIYGTELRQHISVAEILAEAFQRGDKRANNYRVGEVMDNLRGWTLGDRLRNTDPQYPDQTKPYFRDKQAEDDEPTEEQQSETPTNDFIGETLNLENPPF